MHLLILSKLLKAVPDTIPRYRPWCAIISVSSYCPHDSGLVLFQPSSGFFLYSLRFKPHTACLAFVDVHALSFTRKAQSHAIDLYTSLDRTLPIRCVHSLRSYMVKHIKSNLIHARISFLLFVSSSPQNGKTLAAIFSI